MSPDGVTDVVLEAVDVHRGYGSGRGEIHALRGVSLTVVRGEVVAVMGPSGCGKTTLLHLLGGLDEPDRGDVRIDGQRWASTSGRARARRRGRRCGFVFQTLALLPMATASENVEVPLLLAGAAASERRALVLAMLDRVGLVDKADHLPDQLSGGEQQRVGIARALVHQPAVVLADEPTGSLDSVTAAEIIRLLVATASERNAAVVLVTHDPTVGAAADRVVRLRSGLVETGPPMSLEAPA